MYLDVVELRAGLVPGGRVGGAAVLLSAAAHTVEAHALAQHADAQTLAEAARLARLAPPLVDLALVGRRARVV